jgi:hypothetical protein
MNANVKQLSGATHPDRNEQFEYPGTLKAEYKAVGLPVINVYTKKKEQIGNFNHADRLGVRKQMQSMIMTSTRTLW